MPISFTQYLLPDGRRQPISIDRAEDIEALAQRFIAAGGKFEAEVLTTGVVSLTAAFDVDGEQEDIAIKLCGNGPGVGGAVDELVREAIQYIEALAS